MIYRWTKAAMLLARLYPFWPPLGRAPVRPTDAVLDLAVAFV
jgi:hypothetical protein